MLTRSLGTILMIFVLTFTVVLGALPVHAEQGLTVDSGNVSVQLTETQKQELAALHQDILAKQKEVVAKYVEYGVITQEKGDKIISRLEKRYEKLEQNQFIPKWAKCRKNSKK